MDSTKKSNKKDIWDKIKILSVSMSAVIISGIGLYFTHKYNNRQVEIAKINAIEKFIPHLIKEGKSQELALLSLYQYDPKLASQTAQLYGTDSARDAIDKIMTTYSPTQEALPESIVTSQNPNVKSSQGWIYIGQYSINKENNEKKWLKKYFSDIEEVPPKLLIGKTLRVSDREVNVRESYPTLTGYWPKIIARLSKSSEVLVLDKKEVGTFGNIWLKVSYKK